MAEQLTWCDGCGVALYDRPSDDVGAVELCDKCAAEMAADDEADGLESVSDMASNDSNEGNDTAAQAAFQVGDRVRWRRGSVWHFGTLRYVTAERAEVRGDDGLLYVGTGANLTLISRATPAQAAPAQTVADDYDDDIAFSLYCHTSQHDLCHNPDCACSCHDTPRAASEPATPAPAATPPALDTHAIPSSIFGKLLWCAMGGKAWAAWDQACRLGDVPPDVTLANLMEAAARLGVNRAIDLLT